MPRQQRSNPIHLTTPDGIALRTIRPEPLRKFLCCAILAGLLGLTGTASVMAAPPPLPALVEPASQEHHVGKVIFVELVTPDIDAAKRFYADLFGWSFRDFQARG